MYYNRTKLIAGLGTLVFGAFAITVFFLPRETGIIRYSGAIDGFFRRRTDWGIAWAVLFGGLIAGIAIVFLIEAFVRNNDSSK